MNVYNLKEEDGNETDILDGSERYSIYQTR